MRSLSFVRFSALSLLIAFATAARAGPLEDGLAARKSGDFPAAIAMLRPLATSGTTQAQFALGEIYERGQGVSKDYTEALKWYRLAAESGYAPAEVNIGMLYSNGQGVSKDDSEAFKWFRQAADRGDPKAQTNVAIMYRNGQGVAKNQVEAKKWYQLGATQGYAEAQSSLGHMFYVGEGGDKDITQSLKYTQLAAEQGDVKAQTRLGIMHYVGQGVTTDLVRGLMWLQVSAAGGDQAAVRARDVAIKPVAPEQITQAQQLADECKQRNFKGCSAQTFTADVPKYLKDSFGIQYTALSDGLSCREDAPVPANKGKTTAFINCQGSIKDGFSVGIGWKSNSFERDAAHKRIGFLIRISSLPWPSPDTAKDVVTCAPKTDGYQTEKGDLIQCKVEFFGAKESQKTAYFSVFYPRVKNNLDYGLFVGAIDNFTGKPEVATAIALEYQSRIQE